MKQKILLWITVIILLIHTVIADTSITGDAINCANTNYVFCDDFSDNSIDTDKWNAGATCSETDESMKCTTAGGSGNGNELSFDEANYPLPNDSAWCLEYTQKEINPKSDGFYQYYSTNGAYAGDGTFVVSDASLEFYDGINGARSGILEANGAFITQCYNGSGGFNLTFWKTDTTMNYTANAVYALTDNAVWSFLPWTQSTTNISYMIAWNGTLADAPYLTPVATPQNNFTITASDEWNSTSILTFNATVDGVDYGSNSSGVIEVDLLINSTSLHNVTIWGATNYFNRTYLNLNVSSALSAELHQAEVCFNGEAKISYQSLTLTSVIINGETSASCFNLSANTYNVQANLNGWYSQNQTFTVTALQNNTQTVVNMTHGNLTIYAIDALTNESLTNYDISVESLAYPGWGGETATGTQNHSFYLINGTYSVSVDVPGYALTYGSANVTLNGSTNHTFNLYPTNSVYIRIYDEITNDLITENVTVRWSSNSTTWENITQTGLLFVNDIPQNEYQLLIYSSNYSTRTYTITVGNRTSQNLNAYLISSTYSTIFTIKDIDTSVVLENVSITMYKQLNSSWVIVESKYSDISGKSQFYYDPIGHYRFQLAKSDYEDYIFYLNPILFSSYDVFMTKTTLLNYSVDYDSIGVLYSPTFFLNDENTSFYFLISSPDGLFTEYGIKLTYPGGSDSASGTNAIGEQLNAWVNLSGATAYDTVRLDYNYTTTTSGTRTFTVYLPIGINATSSSNTLLSNKSKTYGLGIFERILIATIIILFIVGIASLVGQIVPGLALGLFVFGFLAHIGFIPLWAILPSMMIGFLVLVWKSGGY